MVVIITSAPINALTAALNYRRGGGGYRPIRNKKKDKKEPEYKFDYPESKYWKEVASRDSKIKEKTKDTEALAAQGIVREDDNYSTGDEFYSSYCDSFSLYYVDKNNPEHPKQLRYESIYTNFADYAFGGNKQITNRKVNEYYPDGKIKFSATPEAYREYDKEGKPYKGEFYSYYGKEATSKVEHLRIYEDGKEVEYHHYDKNGKEDTESYLKKQNRREKTSKIIQSVKSVFSKSR